MQIVAKLILLPLMDVCIFFYIGNYNHLSYRAKKKMKRKKKILRSKSQHQDSKVP